MQLDNAFVRQGQIFDAMVLPTAGIATYQTALQFHPDNFEIHLELAKALEKEHYLIALLQLRIANCCGQYLMVKLDLVGLGSDRVTAVVH